MKQMKLLIMTCVLMCGFGTAGWAQATIADGNYFLYDVEDGLFLSRGADWGTRATLDPYGHPVTWASESGTFTFLDLTSFAQKDDTNKTKFVAGNNLFITGTDVYTDNAGSGWAFEETGTEGQYYLKHGDKYIVKGSSVAYSEYHKYGLSASTDKAKAIKWAVKTGAEQKAILATYAAQNYTNVATSASWADVSSESFLTTLESSDYKAIDKTSKILGAALASETDGENWTWTQCRTGYWGGWNGEVLKPAYDQSIVEFFQQSGYYSQQVTGLNPGIYKVTVNGFDRASGFENCNTWGAAGIEIVTAYLKANQEQINLKSWYSGRTAPSNPNWMNEASTKFAAGAYQNELYTYVGADGVLNLAIAIPGYGTGGRWVCFNQFTLTYYASVADFNNALNNAKAAQSNALYTNVTGKEKVDLIAAITAYDGTTPDDLNAAITDLVSVTDAFIAAKDAYDALVVENGKAAQFGLDTYTVTDATTAAIAIDETHKMMVAECNKVADDYTLSVKLGEWTTTGPVGSLSGQHWDGKVSSFYYEQSGTAYGQSSWDITYTQDVKLPAGNYVFKMTGRHGSNSGVLNNTMELIVKSGETQIGTVNDFPVGDTGLGVNKNGMTSFDAKDAAGFANDNKGRGWQWRYVPFTLDAETTVTFTIHAAATGIYQWVSFCNYTVEAQPNVAIWKVVHQQAKEEAETAQSTYTNVKGKELNDLTTALAITPEESIESLTAAINQLKSATNAFISANDDWSRYLIASQTATAAGISYTDISTDTEKTSSDALTAANGLLKQSADAVKTVDLYGKTIGFEAGEWTLYLIQPSLTYIATLLGEDGNAADEKINAADALAIKNAVVAIKGWKANEEEVNAVVSPISAEAWTGASEGWRYTTLNTASTGTTGTSAFANSGTITYGTASGYSMPLKANTVYVLKFKHASWDDSNKDNGGTVSVLNAGGEGLVASDYAGNGTNKTGWFNTETYLFRTGAAGNYTLTLVADGGRSTLTDISIFKATASDLTIDEATGYTPAAAYANVSLKRTFVTGWNGLVLPFDMTAEEAKTTFNATAVKDFDEVTDDGSNATLKFVDAENIKAGVPVLIKVTAPAESNTYALSNVWLPGTALQNVNKKSTNADFTFTGTYSATTDLQAVSFVLIQGDKLYSHDANSSGTTAKSMRAYFVNNATEGAKSLNILFDLDGETTAITEVKDNSQTTQTYYDMQGRRILKPVKGLYIQNGKKVVIK